MVGFGCISQRIDEIPLPAEICGRLYATNFSAVGPDPGAALRRVDASTIVCLLTEQEIGLRYPEYADWLAAHSDPRGEASALWLSVDDGGVGDDDDMAALVDSVCALLHEGHGVVVHCGAGMARTAVVCIAAMVALGADESEAAAAFRRSRPGGGPDGPAQAAQIERLNLRRRHRH